MGEPYGLLQVARSQANEKRKETKVRKRTSTVGTHDLFYLLRLGQLFLWIEGERWQEGDRPW